jgi:uncharacterized membrane protein SirB2
MIKIIHLCFALLSFSSFIGKVTVSELKPELLKQKAFKIAPHVIDSILLLSGITLVFLGDWLSGNFGWIIAKLLALIAYIALGIVTMKSTGTSKWYAFAGAIACFMYIGMVAVTKNALLFF